LNVPGERSNELASRTTNGLSREFTSGRLAESDPLLPLATEDSQVAGTVLNDAERHFEAARIHEPVAGGHGGSLERGHDVECGSGLA
jgi:hypothetical protein